MRGKNDEATYHVILSLYSDMRIHLLVILSLYSDVRIQEDKKDSIFLSGSSRNSSIEIEYDIAGIAQDDDSVTSVILSEYSSVRIQENKKDSSFRSEY